MIKAKHKEPTEQFNGTYHGTLVCVNRIGILITGQPGIGKSRLAYDLLNLNHQFICDDATDLFIELNGLIGKSPPAIYQQLWLNGRGLIDASKYWGVEAILPEQKIDFLLELKKESPGMHFDTHTILGIALPRLCISPHYPALTFLVENIKSIYEDTSIDHPPCPSIEKRRHK